MKKNKKLLWIIIAAVVVVLASAAVAAYFLLNKPTAAADSECKVYWNVEGESYYAGTYTRKKDKKTGYVRVLLAVDGKQQNFDVVDMSLAKKMDTLKCFGVTFDDSGVITDITRIEDFTGGYAARNFYVSAVNGNTIETNMAPGYNGLPLTLTIDENTKVYNGGAAGPLVGMETQIGIDDGITAIKGEDGHIDYVYVAPYVEPGDVYWNAYRMWDSTLGSTTREADELGRYEFTLACNGELVTLYAKSFDIANALDKVAAKCFGLAFDEDGYITEVIDAKVTCKGSSMASWFDVTDITGNDVTFKRMFSTNAGSIVMGTMSKYCGVWNVSGQEEDMGKATTLKVGDRVHCLTDSRGFICNIFVVNRHVDSPVYWNVQSMWDSTEKKSTREAVGGWYTFLLAADGKQVTLKSKDKAIADAIDSRAGRYFGLVLDGNVIQQVVDASVCVYPGGSWGSWTDVTSISGKTVKSIKNDVNSTLNGKEYVGTLADDCKIYNVSSRASMVGEATTVRVGDRVHGLLNEDGKIAYLLVVDRYEDLDIAWNITRKYDTTKKESTRKADAEGYYVFDFYYHNQKVTAKTKDLNIVNTVDAQAGRCIGVEIKNGIITKAIPGYNAKNTKGGSKGVSWVTVTKVSGKTVTTRKLSEGASDYGKEYTFTMAAGCEICNASNVYIDHPGEKTAIQVGDIVQAYHNADGEATYVVVISRTDSSLDLYWNVTQKYDKTKAETTRVAENGVYSLDMIYGGKVVTLTCKDKTMVSFIDSVASHCVALRVKNGEITFAAKEPIACLVASGGYSASWADITEISADGKTVTCLKPENGVTYKLTLDDKFQAYNTNASQCVDHLGEVTQLKVGQKIHCYRNEKGNVQRMFIISYTKPAETAKHTCSAVTHTGTWYAFNSNSTISKSGYYVVTEDFALTSRVKITADMDVTLCLDGHKITSVDRMFNVYGKLTICDHKNAGEYKGSLTSTYSAASGNAYGGMFYLYNDNKAKPVLTIKGGNFIYAGTGMTFGGIAVVGNNDTGTAATLNLVDGKLSGGISKSYGGAIYGMWGSVVNVSGGTIENCTAATKGAAIFLTTASTLNLSGGRIESCESKSAEGAVNVPGGCKVNVSGAPVVTGNKGGNLTVADSTAISVSSLQNAAKLGLKMATPGIFAKDCDLADCFTSDDSLFKIQKNGSDLEYITTVVPHIHCICGGIGTVGDHTNCSDITWTAWSSDNSLPTESGKYYLMSDISLKARYTIGKAADVTICLNGHTVTDTDRVFCVYGKLTITDCGTTGTISTSKSGSTYGAIAYLYNDSGATPALTMYNGTLKYTGTGITFGGIAVIGNQSESNNGGVSTFTMYGGTITGGKTTGSAGNINVIHNSVVNLYGGTITGGTCGVNGKDICMANTATLNLSGKVTVGDIYLPANTPVHIGDLDITSSSVGISAAADTVIAADLTKDVSAAFKSNFSDRSVKYESGTLKVVASTSGHVHCVCGGLGKVGDHTACSDTTWTAWTSVNSLPKTSGKYYLTANVTLSSRYTVSGSDDVYICLNGHTVTDTDRVFGLYGKLTITDCGTTGSVSTSKSGSTYGAIVYMYNDSGANPTFTLYKGTLKYTGTGITFGGIAVVGNKTATDGGGVATFNMYGGTITGGKTTGVGGNLNVIHNSVLNMYGGTITGGTCGTNGKDVCVAATATILLSGNVQIGDAYIYNGTTVKIGELADTASVGITMQTPGTIATGLTKDVSSCFVCNNSGKAINYQSGSLVMGQPKLMSSFKTTVLNALKTLLAFLF